jgi:hypothetical protein
MIHAGIMGVRADAVLSILPVYCCAGHWSIAEKD